jgi:hypothetical protein
MIHIETERFAEPRGAEASLGGTFVTIPFGEITFPAEMIGSQ